MSMITGLNTLFHFVLYRGHGTIPAKCIWVGRNTSKLEVIFSVFTTNHDSPQQCWYNATPPVGHGANGKLKAAQTTTTAARLNVRKECVHVL